MMLHVCMPCAPDIYHECHDMSMSKCDTIFVLCFLHTCEEINRRENLIKSEVGHEFTLQCQKSINFRIDVSADD